MPSVPNAGLLAYRRRGAVVEVLLRSASRDGWQVPQWQPAVEEPPAAASIEERLRRPRRARTPTVRQLLELACSCFSDECGTLPAGPFSFLGGVKQRGHRILYVWAGELDRDTCAAPPGTALRFFDLPHAREAISAQQRRFLDELEALLGGGGQDP